MNLLITLAAAIIFFSVIALVVGSWKETGNVWEDRIIWAVETISIVITVSCMGVFSSALLVS